MHTHSKLPSHASAAAPTRRHTIKASRGHSKIVRDAALREQAEEALRKQSAILKMLQEVAVAANEASQVEAVIGFALEHICRYTGWPVGLAYEVSGGGNEEMTLMPVHALAIERPFQQLLAASQSAHFSRGIGLPGIVYASGE